MGVALTWTSPTLPSTSGWRKVIAWWFPQVALSLYKSAWKVVGSGSLLSGPVSRGKEQREEEIERGKKEAEGRNKGVGDRRMEERRGEKGRGEG